MVTMSGWCSTLIGRKRFYLWSFALFTFGAILCGTARSFPYLRRGIKKSTGPVSHERPWPWTGMQIIPERGQSENWLFTSPLGLNCTERRAGALPLAGCNAM